MLWYFILEAIRLISYFHKLEYISLKANKQTYKNTSGSHLIGKWRGGHGNVGAKTSTGQLYEK